jgi:hypothetical protein
MHAINGESMGSKTAVTHTGKQKEGFNFFKSSLREWMVSLAIESLDRVV